MDVMSVPIIAAISLVLSKIIEKTVKNEKFKAFAPLILSIIGGIFGIVCFYLAPTLLPTTNVIHAFLIGLVSGVSGSVGSAVLPDLNLNKATTQNDEKNVK